MIRLNVRNSDVKNINGYGQVHFFKTTRRKRILLLFSAVLALAWLLSDFRAKKTNGPLYDDFRFTTAAQNLIFHNCGIRLYVQRWHKGLLSYMFVILNDLYDKTFLQKIKFILQPPLTYKHNLFAYHVFTISQIYNRIGSFTKTRAPFFIIIILCIIRMYLCICRIYITGWKMRVLEPIVLKPIRDR